MLGFIFENINNKDAEVIIAIIRGNDDNSKLIETMSKIVPDERTNGRIEGFQKRFRSLLETNNLSKKQFKKLIYFVYLVRNNIFHGTKNIIDMSEKDQRKRLDIYSNILNGTNELLFRVLERKTNFNPDKRYTLRM